MSVRVSFCIFAGDWCTSLSICWEATLDEFTPETTTESVTRTITFPLETSAKKNEYVRTGIEEFQAMAAFMADMLPSYSEYRWTNRDTTMYRMVTREFPDAEMKATIAREAAGHIASAFQSWCERGKPGDRPQFGDGDYLVLSPSASSHFKRFPRQPWEICTGSSSV